MPREYREQRSSMERYSTDLQFYQRQNERLHSWDGAMYQDSIRQPFDPEAFMRMHAAKERERKLRAEEPDQFDQDHGAIEMGHDA